MPENYFDAIAQRVAEIAKKTATAVNPVSLGTVLSVNSDGSINVDDGMGGCARVANVTNQIVQCGQTVVLGLEPQIGTTTNLCQVQFTINSSSKGCPIETRIDDVEVDPPMPMIFSDDDGNLYDESGDPTGDTGDLAARDISFDYTESISDDFYAGPSSNYQTLQIGHVDIAPDHSGYQGIHQGQVTGNHNVGNTRLVQGIGASSGLLFGLELLNTSDGSHEDTWTLTIRDSTTLALGASAGSTWLSDWFDSRPDSYLTVDEDWEFGNSLHVAPDPVDGSFWLWAKAGVNGERGGMFNIDPTDATLIQTINVDAVDGQFTKRMKRIS